MKVAKAVVAAVLSAATAANVALNDNAFSTTEAVTIVLAVLTAVGVYAVPNKHEDHA